MEQRGFVGGWKMKHLHSGPGNEGVFLRDDTRRRIRERQRGREVKQREDIRSGVAITTLIPAKFLAVKMAPDCDTLKPKDHAHACKYFILPQFEAHRCLCFMRGPILYLSRGCSGRASQGGFGLWDVLEYSAIL